MSKAAADPRKKVERAVLQQLESLEQAGVMQLPKVKLAARTAPCATKARRKRRG